MFIYIMQAGANGPLKVGCTRTIAIRLAQTQTHNHEKIRLLHLFIGDRKDETEIHARFSLFHKHGEWFFPVRALLNGDINLPVAENYTLDPRKVEPKVAQLLPDTLSHKQIIAALGGPVAVRRVLGLGPGNNCHWWRRGIPSRYWEPLSRIPKRDGTGFVSVAMFAHAAKFLDSEAA